VEYETQQMNIKEIISQAYREYFWPVLVVVEWAKMLIEDIKMPDRED
jgi:hypothetical protein